MSGLSTDAHVLPTSASNNVVLSPRQADARLTFGGARDVNTLNFRLYHDSAAALVDDGRIVAAAQEERFTRTEHVRPTVV